MYREAHLKYGKLLWIAYPVEILPRAKSAHLYVYPLKW